MKKITIKTFPEYCFFTDCGSELDNAELYCFVIDKMKQGLEMLKEDIHKRVINLGKYGIIIKDMPFTLTIEEVKDK